MSETLRAELEPHGVGVSVLCPGRVRTGLSDSSEDGLEPSVVGAQVLDAIRKNEFYVMTHGELGAAVAARGARLQQAFDSAPNWLTGDNTPGATVATS